MNYFDILLAKKLTGGGSPTPPVPPAPISPTRSGATIYDYDGSVIATYTPEEFAALTEYPTHPTHEYLTADGYNRSLANAQAYSAKYGYVEVGALYHVTDGKTRLFIRLEESRLEPWLGLGINGSVDVDWGDGSAHDTMTGSNVNTTVYQMHTYAQAGDYIIVLTVTGSVQFNGTSGYGLVLSRLRGTKTADVAYLNALHFLYIGNGVTRISDNAFAHCYSLTSITIPNSVPIIATRAFANCYSLTSITIPDGIKYINSSTTSYCVSLSSIIMPDSITDILSDAFSDCYSLTSIAMPDGITKIYNQIFDNCCILDSITIPDSVGEISSKSFANCRSLSFIKFTSETPPRATSNAWNGIPTDCIIYVPQGTRAAYTSATGYPDPVAYTYVEY